MEIIDVLFMCIIFSILIFEIYKLKKYKEENEIKMIIIRSDINHLFKIKLSDNIRIIELERKNENGK
jgi:hypothetical protein